MRRALVAIVAVLAAAGARAQFVQYTAPGSLAVEQTPTKERLEKAMEDARWHLGSVRVGPWFAIKDVGYLNNVYGTVTDQQSDFTATVGAGAHFYLPVGGKLILGAYALPEYVWWRDIAERRGWNGRGGAGLFGYFNRVTLEVQAGVSRQQQYASSEIEVPVNVDDNRAEALFEVRVLGRMSVFARGSADRWRYDQRGLPGPLGSQLLLLERDESRAGGGLRYRFGKASSVGVGVERITNDFVHPENDISNSGTAPMLELNLQGAHLWASASAVALDLKPDGSSQFVPYSGTTGQVQLGWRPRGRLGLVLYGGRNLVYSTYYVDTPYFVEERTGVSVQTPLGWRTSVGAFYERGRDNYVASSGAGMSGTNDFSGYGATLGFKLGRWATLVFRGWRNDYTGGEVGFYEHSVTQVQTSIEFSGGTMEWW